MTLSLLFSVLPSFVFNHSIKYKLHSRLVKARVSFIHSG